MIMSLTIQHRNDEPNCVDLTFEYDLKRKDGSPIKKYNWTNTPGINQDHQEIYAVKEYGPFLGRILAVLGYASLVEDSTHQKVYVNTRSLFRHLTDTWCKANNRFDILVTGTLKDENTPFKEILKEIEKDQTIDKSILTEEKIKAIFKKCDDISSNLNERR